MNEQILAAQRMRDIVMLHSMKTRHCADVMIAWKSHPAGIHCRND